MTDHEGIKFTASKRDLVAGLAWAVKGLSTRPVLPVLAGMRLEASQGQVKASGFDYEHTCSARIGAEVAAAGTVLVRGRELAAAVKGLPGKPAAEVTATAEDGMLTLESEGVTASVELLDLAEYPQLPAMPAEAAVIAGEVFAATVARVTPAACRDDTLPVLCGIHFTIAPGAITLAATDRYRLAVETMHGTLASDDEREMVIPVRILADFAGKAGKAGKVTLHIDGNQGTRTKAGNLREVSHVGFSDGARSLITRAISGDFPPYGKLIPKDEAGAAIADAGKLADAVKRAGAQCERNGAVALTFTRDTVTVTTRKDGKVTSRQAVPCSLDVPAVKGHARVTGWRVAFNPEYLWSILLGVTGPARLSWASWRKPMVKITGDGAPAGTFTGLVCNIRSAEEPRPRYAKPEPAAETAPADTPAPEEAPPPVVATEPEPEPTATEEAPESGTAPEPGQAGPAGPVCGECSSPLGAVRKHCPTCDVHLCRAFDCGTKHIHTYDQRQAIAAARRQPKRHSRKARRLQSTP